MLDLSQFTLQRAVIEIRYDPAFFIWDRAGSLADRLHKSFPDFKSKDARPNQQTHSLTNKISITLELEKAFLITAFPPDDLDEFRSAADKVFPVVIELFELKVLKRIGFRTFYEKRFESLEDTSTFVLGHLPASKRAGKYFNIEGKISNPELSLRWENEAMGCTVRFQTLEAKLEVDVPAEFGRVDPIYSKKHYAQLDIDYYASSSTPVSKFRAGATIENWLKLIKRDLGEFVNG